MSNPTPRGRHRGRDLQPRQRSRSVPWGLLYGIVRDHVWPYLRDHVWPYVEEHVIPPLRWLLDLLLSG